MKKTIILINGPKTSGKNYVGALLGEYLQSNNFSVKEFSFAKAIKEDVATIMNMSLEDIEKYKESDEVLVQCDNLTMRQIFQNYGMLRRVEDDNIWVDIVIEEIANDIDTEVSIITDFRFPNESVGIKKFADNFTTYTKGNAEVITIYIENNNVVTNDEHISENALKNYTFDIKIDNNTVFSTKEEAKARFESTFERIKKSLR